jgi:hypothetical protein
MAQVRIRSIVPNQSRTAGGGAARITCEDAGAVQGTVTVGGTSATIVTWSDTYIDITYPAKAAGTYDLVVTNDDPTSDTYTNAVSVADPGTPILTNGEAALKSLVEGMSIASGYHFDWGTGTQPDEALATDVMALIERVESPFETNLDDLEGAHSFAYLNTFFYRITVRGKLTTEESLPRWEIMAIWNKLLDDMKKRFGTGSGSTLNGTVQHFAYQNAQVFNELSGDRFKPGRMETFWVGEYIQDRTDPSVNG